MQNKTIVIKAALNIPQPGDLNECIGPRTVNPYTTVPIGNARRVSILPDSRIDLLSNPQGIAMGVLVPTNLRDVCKPTCNLWLIAMNDNGDVRDAVMLGPGEDLAVFPSLNVTANNKIVNIYAGLDANCGRDGIAHLSYVLPQ